MSEVRADVATAYEDGMGVVFHVEMPGRRVKVQVPTETLVEMGAGSESGALAAFVQANEPAIQLMVNDGVETGWTGPLTLMV